MATDTLIVVETAQGALPASVGELIAVACRLREPAGARVGAVLIGEATDTLAQALGARGVDRVYRVQCPEILDQAVEARLAPILEVCTRMQPRVVLLAHASVGAELAPRLAFRLDGAAALGCVEVTLEADRVLCTRPCYGGLVRETSAYVHAPVVATLRAGVCEPAAVQPGRSSEIVDLAIAATARTLEQAEGVRLEEARTIVAGGRGLEGAEGFRTLEQLAAELGAAVGASRVPCDLGWCPHSWQIGLTGKTVTPELYIAVGISGAGHHMAGCGNAKAIVAINTDPEAAIFQDARFGVVGDYREVVPAFAAAVRKLKQSAQG